MFPGGPVHALDAVLEMNVRKAKASMNSGARQSKQKLLQHLRTWDSETRNLLASISSIRREGKHATKRNVQDKRANLIIQAANKLQEQLNSNDPLVVLPSASKLHNEKERKKALSIYSEGCVKMFHLIMREHQKHMPANLPTQDKNNSTALPSKQDKPARKKQKKN